VNVASLNASLPALGAPARTRQAKAGRKTSPRARRSSCPVPYRVHAVLPAGGDATDRGRCWQRGLQGGSCGGFHLARAAAPMTRRARACTWPAIRAVHHRQPAWWWSGWESATIRTSADTSERRYGRERPVGRERPRRQWSSAARPAGSLQHPAATPPRSPRGASRRAPADHCAQRASWRSCGQWAEHDLPRPYVFMKWTARRVVAGQYAEVSRKTLSCLPDHADHLVGPRGWGPRCARHDNELRESPRHPVR